jgi:hypothetical protein
MLIIILNIIIIIKYNKYFIVKVSTKAALDCMCRPCTGIEEYSIIPQEIADLADNGPLSSTAHFRHTL